MGRIVLHILTLILAPLPVLAAGPNTGIAIHSDPSYPPGFSHFNYVNPDAPKGGELRLSQIGTYDNLNPFIARGVAAGATRYIFDTLMVPSSDEIYSMYGLVAETVEIADDRSSVIFNLRVEGAFHNGAPITADDVIWTFEALRTKGHPFYAAWYHNVLGVEKLGTHRVQFNFGPGNNRDLPLLLGELPILSKSYYATRTFDETTLESPLGSGPYKILTIDAGRSIVLQRVDSYWARDLAVNKGRYNFDRLRVDYYRDQSVALEAFRAGYYDFRLEESAKAWVTGYSSPALSSGRIKRESVANGLPQGMQGFVFNTRRVIFKDRLTRSALNLLFDFEWVNKFLFFDSYVRTESFFSNSELASRGLPSTNELAVLEPLKDKLPPEVMTTEYVAAKTDGSGNIRQNMTAALKLLNSAGWVVKNGKMVEAATGKPMSFEILLSGSAFEAVAQLFVRNLVRLGIDVSIRIVDATQYRRRLNSFDFDMIVQLFPQSLSPGREQHDYWNSTSADTMGTINLIGIKEEAVDRLVDLLISASTREEQITIARALDRVLLWHHFVIPLWHNTHLWLAYWDKFGKPSIFPKYGGRFVDTWWVNSETRGQK